MANSAFQQQIYVPVEIITINTAGTSNKGFITNVAGTTTISLPTTSSVGDIFYCATMQGDFQITQVAGQQVLLAGGVSTTSGAGGTMTSNAVGDSASLVCIVANTTWLATGVGGLITIA